MQQDCQPSFDLIDPVLFSIGPFDLRWYALAYIAGLLIGWRYMVGLARRPKLWVPASGKPKGSPFTVDDVDDLLLWATIGVIAGGRLGYVIFYSWEYMTTGLRGAMTQPDSIGERLWWVVRGITEGGMAFHGGLIGVGLALFFVARARKLDLWRIADAAAVVAPIGLFFGRVANFINGELWGRVTDVPWAMRFASDPTCSLRHPSQLYEAALEGVLIFVVVNFATWKHRSLSRPGLNTGIFMVLYGLSRALLETVREPDAHMPEALRGYITMGMILSIPMIFIGAWLIHRALKNEPAPAPVKVADPD
ncbi:prolipoprotein diacylglyceryl transferase [uncultured Demequina sp.]|uniref:prolipoprotein diacylglyceryl transferase n=1 Tax=uncultured Demequina sp. TaxID=693499 RepID=UPI0025CC3424|nr:prolipoprotein diacylglyceryl transferase [uncultured Demequina sp.]